jgi:hypothetical protein
VDDRRLNLGNAGIAVSLPYRLERIRAAVLDPRRAAELRERFAIAKAAVGDPWLERDRPYHPRQFADLDLVQPPVEAS